MENDRMRVHLYIPAEGRIVTAPVASVPAVGDVVTSNGRPYRVTAVHAGQYPAVLSLEACVSRLAELASEPAGPPTAA